METKTGKVLIEPTKENIELVFSKIHEYAKTKGYRIIDEGIILPNSILSTTQLVFKSESQRKKVRNYLTRLNTRVTMSQANKFLHLLFTKVYGVKAPYIDYSEKEVEIRTAKKAWRKAHKEAEALLVTYKETKGDFFKK